MKDKNLFEMLQDTPVICAVKNLKELDASLRSDCSIIFVLFGDILTIPEIVAKINASGKSAFVHIDFIEGLSSREIAVDYLAQNTKAEGVISTKAGIVIRAKKLSFFTVYRCFVLDSIAIKNIKKQIPLEHADVIEILPGAVPKVIKKIVSLTNKPVIASGLITDKEDVLQALNAGAVSVSSSNPSVWKM